MNLPPMLKATLSCFIVIIALLFNLSFFISINAFANITPHNNNVLREKTYDEYFKIYDGETTTECGEYVLSKKLTIYKDSTVNHNSTLYLKKDAILIIKKGSTLTVNGTIIVEDGAKLYITDGSVKINNICNNYGKIIIRKRGKMIIWYHVCNETEIEIINSFLYDNPSDELRRGGGRDGHTFYLEKFIPTYQKYEFWCCAYKEWGFIKKLIDLLLKISCADEDKYWLQINNEK